MQAIFSFQELCTDPCDMGPCIIMQKYELMVADEWHDNSPQYLFTVSLCFQMAIDKNAIVFIGSNLCLPIHNVDISKLFAHNMHIVCG